MRPEWTMFEPQPNANKHSINIEFSLRNNKFWSNLEGGGKSA
jgi:hypothetical protein